MSPTDRLCPHCGAPLTTSRLECPSCGQRIHVLRHAGLEDRPAAPSKPSPMAKAAGAGGAAFLLWKLWGLILFVLSKAKLILFALSKGSTFFSMLLSAWAYSGQNGWGFGLGFVLSIYIHEMGHVYVLRRYGIQASAPLFIPFVGAIIRLKQRFDNPAQDARVGLAGPLAGLGAALLCLVLGQAWDWRLGQALGRIGAWINLFNMIPLWQLDGGRAFNALNRAQRWIVFVFLVLALFLTGEPLLALMALAALFRALGRAVPRKADGPVLALYVGLVAVLAFLGHMPLP